MSPQRNTQLRAYRRTLRESHRMKVVVRIYDQNEDYIATLRHSLIDGQVDVDTKRDIERSCNLILADNSRHIQFDPDGASDAALFADRFVGVSYAVWVPERCEWHVEPVFFGPITRYERDGFQVTVEAQDKSSLLFQPVIWGRWLRNAGLGEDLSDTRYAADLIRAILKTTGEKNRNLEFGTFENARLPRGWTPPKHPENLWQAIKKIVRAANTRNDTDRFYDFRPFYDGRGRLRVESMTSGGFTFSDGPRGVLIDKPQVSYSLTEFRNTVVVKINRPSGRPVRPVVRTLPRRHPLSAVNLGRNDTPRYIVEVIDNNNIRTRERAREVAQSTLRKLSTETLDVHFTCLPIPYLTPGARCTLAEDDDVHHFTADKFTIPLRAADAMSVGFNRQIPTGPKRSVVGPTIPARRFA